MENHIPYYSSIDEAFQRNARIENIKPHFELFRMDRYPEAEVPQIKPFRLNAYVVGFVTDGEAELTINSKKFQLKRGSLYFSSPWDIRAYNNMRNWKGYLLFFTPDYLTQFRFTENNLNEMVFFQPDAGVVIPLPENRIVQLSDWFKDMSAQLESDSPEKLKVLFHYVHILLYRCKEIYAETRGSAYEPVKSSVSALFLEQLNRFFISLSEYKADFQISAQQIADMLHLNPHYLSDLVKKQTGKTATQIIRERYVQEAKTLLRNTEMSVSEISYYLHFKDTSNFTKFFKSIAGYTPREFRERGYSID